MPHDQPSPEAVARASDLLMYMTHNNADSIREYVIPKLKIADKPLCSFVTSTGAARRLPTA